MPVTGVGGGEGVTGGRLGGGDGVTGGGDIVTASVVALETGPGAEWDGTKTGTGTGTATADGLPKMTGEIR